MIGQAMLHLLQQAAVAAGAATAGAASACSSCHTFFSLLFVLFLHWTVLRVTDAVASWDYLRGQFCHGHRSSVGLVRSRNSRSMPAALELG